MYEGIIGPSPKIFPPMHLIQVISKDGVNLSEEEIEAINEEGPIRIMYKTIEEFEKLEGDRPFEIEEKISFDIGPESVAINVQRIE